jgi:hypothetical protein
VSHASKLLNKLSEILSAERKAQAKKYKSLKKVLKALRSEKVRLEEQLASAPDEATREDIASRLKVVSKQRQKGLTVLKELKKERKK